MLALFSFDVHMVFLQLKYMGFVIFHLLKNQFLKNSPVGKVGCSSLL